MIAKYACCIRTDIFRTIRTFKYSHKIDTSEIASWLIRSKTSALVLKQPAYSLLMIKWNVVKSWL